MNEIEILREERIQLHSALAAVINAYGIMSEAYFRLAIENSHKPRLVFNDDINTPDTKESILEEYRKIEDEVMNSPTAIEDIKFRKPVKELKTKKVNTKKVNTISYLG